MVRTIGASSGRRPPRRGGQRGSPQSPQSSGRRGGQRGSPTRNFAARTITVPGAHDGRRLDKYIRSQLKGVPATLLFRLMREGKIRVNGAKVKQNHRVSGGDELTLPDITVEEASKPRRVPDHLVATVKDAIVHECDELIVVDKPVDLAVHRGTGVEAGVIEALRQARPDLPDLELAHRIDRETSGLLMVAKTSATLRHLQGVLRDRERDIKRHYLALVDGHWPGDLTVSTAPLRRTERRTIVSPTGQRSETRFTVAKRHGRHATLIEAQLITGRKHQIRVHCEHAGHPIGGDTRYGSAAFNRTVAGRGITGMLLHAHRLEVPMRDGSTLTVEAPPPAEWDRF